MRIAISSIVSRVLISLTFLFSSGCSASNEINETISITGKNYGYSIPSRYIKPPNSILQVDLEIGDKGSSTALLISDIEDSELGSDFSVYLLLFYDKLYEQEKVLLDASKSFSNKSLLLEEVAGLYRYQQALGDSVADYYFSFDPAYSELSPIDGSDFYARIQNVPGLEIDGVTTYSKSSCQIRSVYDGILIQATIVDEICIASNLTKFKKLQDKVMESWRSDS